MGGDAMEKKTEDHGAMTAKPTHLDKAMVAIEVKLWMALGTVLLVLGVTLIWAFFGTMQLREDVTGVLVKSGRAIEITAPDTSTLLDLSISRNQMVKRDQVIARIEQDELVHEINAMVEAGAPEAEVHAKRMDLVDKSQIVTYEAGRVMDIYVHAGDYINKGDRIATLLQDPKDGANMKCLLFVPARQVKNISKGMYVNVYPAFANKEEYGSMYGTVASVSDYPVTRQYLFDILGSEELAAEFSRDAACYEVVVNLTTSEETATGYAWTTSLGPSQEPENISLCDASVIRKELRPIDVFFLRQ